MSTTITPGAQVEALAGLDLLDSLPCIAAALDRHGRVLYANSALAGTLGLKREEIVGRTVDELPVPAAIASLARAAASAEPGVALPRGIEVAWPSASGERLLSVTLAWRSLQGQPREIILSGFDLTDKRESVQRAERERDFAVQVMTTLGQGVAVEDEQWRLQYVNPAFALLVGRNATELIGKRAIDFALPEQAARVMQAQSRREAGHADAYELTFVHADGTLVPTLVTGAPWLRDGRPAGAIAVVTDLTATKATEAELAQRSSEAEALLEFSKMVDVQTDLESSASAVIEVLSRAVRLDAAAFAFHRGDTIELQVIWSSPRSTVPLGYKASLPRGEGLTWLAFERAEPLYVDDYPAQATASSVWLRLGLGAVALLPLADSRHGDPVIFIGGRFADAGPWLPRDRELLEAAARSARATIERVRRMRQVERAAHEDALTGIGNRRAFDSALDAALAASRHDGVPFSVLAMDLDGLKDVNDRHGHPHGDTLLREFARALRTSLRREDRIYRFGGDEFAAILPHTGENAHGGPLERVQVAVQIVREAGFPDFDVSVGIASYPDEGNSTGEVVRLADLRLYECKRLHKTR